MDKKCMVCSEKLGPLFCVAQIEDMKVSLCYKDSKKCETCEVVSCRFNKRYKPGIVMVKNV